MKNLKITLKTLPLLLLITFASCKKDKNNGPESAPIATEELLDHYITMVINGNPSLRILYFNREGAEVKATVDMVSSRRIQAIKITGNSFTFDADGDGKKVYTFKLAKDATGKLNLTSSEYKNLDDANVSIEYAQINRTAEAETFKDAIFDHIGDNNSYLMFPQDAWYWNVNPWYDGLSPSAYYVISSGAWKGTRDGADYLGISVPAWRTFNEPVMVVQKSSSAEVAVYRALNQ